MISNTIRRRKLFNRPCAVKGTMIAASLVVWVGGLFIPAVLAAQDVETRQVAAAPIRVALSAGSFAGLNNNDVLAAIKTWAKAILKQRALDLEVETRIIDRPEELAEALWTGQADAASMSTNEFLELKAKPEFIYLPTKKHSFTEKYVILVHRDSGINDVADLRGRKLLLHNNSRMGLASAWVEGLQGFPKTALVGMIRIDNASRIVLQVFFRQADACVVTSRVFEIASELNPQLQKELRVLATSPEVVPSVFFFRPGYESHDKDEFEAAMLVLHETPAGHQVLTMFQGDGLSKQPISCLESSQQLWNESGRSSRGKP
jgi:ABC-type phosphate/phosphonate transport system substrate-binding protein